MKPILALMIFIICIKFNCPRDTRNHRSPRKHEHKRIINGNVTNQEKYPFAVAYLYRSGDNGYYDQLGYGAAIIHKHWAVTAAHAAFIMMRYHGMGKKWGILVSNSSFIKGPNANYHHLISMLYHPFYYYGSNTNDVGLVKVKEPFIGVHEAPIPIAPRDYNYKLGSTASLLGWGYIDTTVTMESWVLRVGDIKLSYTAEKCRKLYTWFNYLNGGLLNIFVTNSTFCAWSPNSGHCVGDSGGAVIQNGVIIGILSVRADCASPRFPAVYTKISLFNDWIQKTIKGSP